MSAYADRFEALYSNFLLGYKEVMGDPPVDNKDSKYGSRN